MPGDLDFEDLALYKRLVAERHKIQATNSEKRKRKEDLIKKREEGFQVYISGANEERIAQRKKEQQIGGRVPSRVTQDGGGGAPGIPIPAGGGGLGGWKRETVEIRADDGRMIRISPTGEILKDENETAMDQSLAYSMDFEQDSILEATGTNGGCDETSDTFKLLQLMETSSKEDIAKLRESIQGFSGGGSLLQNPDRIPPTVNMNFPVPFGRMSAPPIMGNSVDSTSNFPGNASNNIGHVNAGGNSIPSRPSSSMGEMLAAAMASENASLLNATNGCNIGNAGNTGTTGVGSGNPAETEPNSSLKPSETFERRKSVSSKLPLNDDAAIQFRPPSALGCRSTTPRSNLVSREGSKEYPNCNGMGVGMHGMPMPGAPMQGTTGVAPVLGDEVATIDLLLDRVQLLDDRKRRVLSRLLDDWDVGIKSDGNEDAATSLNVDSMSEYSSSARGNGPAHGSSLDVSYHSDDNSSNRSVPTRFNVIYKDGLVTNLASNASNHNIPGGTGYSNITGGSGGNAGNEGSYNTGNSAPSNSVGGTGAPQALLGNSRPQGGNSLGGKALVEIRVMGNHGAGHECEVQYIELVDFDDQAISVQASSLACTGVVDGSASLHRVLKRPGLGTTNSSSSSWHCRTASYSGEFTLSFTVNANASSIKACHIWNGPDAFGIRDTEFMVENVTKARVSVPKVAKDATFGAPTATLSTDGGQLTSSRTDGGMGSPTTEDLHVSRTAGVPIWLQSVESGLRGPANPGATSATAQSKKTPMPGTIREDMEEMPYGDLSLKPDDGPQFTDSPKNSAKKEKQQNRELMQSIDALGKFSTSASRRFFSGDNWNPGGQGASQAGAGASSDPVQQNQQILKQQNPTPGYDFSFDSIEKDEDDNPLDADLALAFGQTENPVSPPRLDVSAGAVVRKRRVLPEKERGPTPNPGNVPLDPLHSSSDEGGNNTGTSAGTRPGKQSNRPPGNDLYSQSPPASQGADMLDQIMVESGATPATASLLSPDINPAELIMPTLPQGRVLLLNLLSTWGDQDFLGLAGIEIFDREGQLVLLKDVKTQVQADPSSINVLPDYDNDPRTADKLFDQVNLTRDDFHVWLTPFTFGRPHTIRVDLGVNVIVSMIRIWNYNKSRLHASRGCREMEIFLDQNLIFMGEIRKATGDLTAPEQACEHILFTTDDDILLKIEERDWLPTVIPEIGDPTYFDESQTSGEEGRPRTGGADRSPNQQELLNTSLQSKLANQKSSDGRPVTSVNFKSEKSIRIQKTLSIAVHATWGCQDYAGITSLEVLDPLLVPISCIDKLDVVHGGITHAGTEGGSAASVNTVVGRYFTGPATSADGVDLAEVLDPQLGEILDIDNSCTTGLQHMYSCDCINGDVKVWLQIDFSEPVDVAGLHIWNFNADTTRGWKTISVYADETFCSTFMVRRGPGHTSFDFKQLILLSQPSEAKETYPRARVPNNCKESSKTKGGSKTTTGEQMGDAGAPGGGYATSTRRKLPLRQYESPLKPCGFHVRLKLKETWGDIYYMGLKRIQLYNADGEEIIPSKVYSKHGSVQDLPGMENDCRVPEALVQQSGEGRGWLAPWIGSLLTEKNLNQAQVHHHEIDFIFDEPQVFAAVFVENYKHTPDRGVKEWEIQVDEFIVYQGIMRQNGHEVVLFTEDSHVLDLFNLDNLLYIPTEDDLIKYIEARPPAKQSKGGGRPETALCAS